MPFLSGYSSNLTILPLRISGCLLSVISSFNFASLLMRNFATPVTRTNAPENDRSRTIHLRGTSSTYKDRTEKQYIRVALRATRSDLQLRDLFLHVQHFSKAESSGSTAQPQTGWGILPTHYLVDKAGRVQLITQETVSWALTKLS